MIRRIRVVVEKSAYAEVFVEVDDADPRYENDFAEFEQAGGIEARTWLTSSAIKEAQKVPQYDWSHEWGEFRIDPHSDIIEVK